MWRQGWSNGVHCNASRGAAMALHGGETGWVTIQRQHNLHGDSNWYGWTRDLMILQQRFTVVCQVEVINNDRDRRQMKDTLQNWSLLSTKLVHAIIVLAYPSFSFKSTGQGQIIALDARESLPQTLGTMLQRGLMMHLASWSSISCGFGLHHGGISQRNIAIGSLSL